MGLKDLVTWQRIRQLADAEVLTPPLHPKSVLIASMVPERPQVTWPHQYHWISKAERIEPEVGSVLYARAAWGGRWRPALRKALTHPVVLTSTFYDLPVRPIDATALLDGTNVSRWFAVQVRTKHPKLTAMPLGVKQRMAPVIEAAGFSDRRDILCYSNFNYLRVGKQPDPERQAIWQHFAAQPWVTTREKLPIGEYIADLGRSRFVLSPPGLGYDCYRTYEAMAMGAIPIVKRQSPATDHLEQMPVLLIDEWSDVTLARLKNMAPSFGFRYPDMLTMTYWRNQIAQAAAACREGVLA